MADTLEGTVSRISQYVVICVLMSCLVLAPVSPAQAPVWQAMGPYGGRVLAVALSPDFVRDGTMLASTANGGLFLSTNRGEQWNHVENLPADLTISALALSPAFAQDGLAFLSTTQSGILRSDDGGQTWSSWSTGLSSLSVTDLAISPDFASDQTLLAATGRGFARTSSAGKRWFPVGPSVTALSVAVSAQAGSPFVAFGGTSIGLYRSDDGGETWATTSLSGQPVLAVALSPFYGRDRSVLVGTLAGAYFSSDGGQSWAGPWMEEQVVHAVAFAPDYDGGGRLYLGADEGFYASTNGGASWQEAETLPGAVDAIVATGPGLYVGGSGGLYLSMDGGVIWAARNRGLLGIAIDTVASAPSFARQPIVLAGGPSGLYRSPDGGATWQMTTLDNARINAIAFAPTDLTANTAYAATSGGLYLSRDQGRTWQTSEATPDVLNVLALALSANANDIWLATAEGGVYYSPDAGASWQQRSAGLATLHTTALLWIDGVGDGARLMAGTWGGGAYITYDGGRSWHAASQGLETPHVQGLARGVGFGNLIWVFVSTTAGLFRSADLCQSWDFAGLLGQDLSSVVLHPNYAERANVYVSGKQDGVFRSLNGGLTWHPLNDGLPSLRLSQIIAATDDVAPLLYAAGQSGVLRYGTVPEPPVAPMSLLRLPLIMNQR